MKPEAGDIEFIRELVPFNQMKDADLATLLEASEIWTRPQGKVIFKRTEEDDRLYWLLSGSIDLLNEQFKASHQKAGEAAARSPLDDNSPHQLTAITTEEARLLVCNRSALPAASGSSRSKGGGPAEKNDWMSSLLSSPLFDFIPPANIQALFNKFEKVKCSAEDRVITQGEEGDYFYVIREGKARVESSADQNPTLLTELQAGDNFGQDALISDAPRNATVTMTTDGALMRLARPDFQALLMEPVIETLTRDQVAEMVQQEEPKTCILDVRTPEEAEMDPVSGATNLPLLSLRNRMAELERNAAYITICDNGKWAALGAWQLNERGFFCLGDATMKQVSSDAVIGHVDRIVRTLGGAARASRPNPADDLPENAGDAKARKVSGRLMRVNHCGEVCAQALYLGQGLTASDPRTRSSLEQAAREETDHLAWCEERLRELDTRRSLANPLFFALSFTSGALSGLLGKRFNLGFLAATEEQVVQHLEEHLKRLPEDDRRSRAILEQMKQDEDSHRTSALTQGGVDFPRPMKKLMISLSRVMTLSTYWI